MNRWILTTALALALAVGVSAAEAKNTLRWSSQGDALTADPHAQNEGPTNSSSLNIYDPLIRRNAKAELEPSLALSWKVVNPTTWEFKLRPGVKSLAVAQDRGVEKQFIENCGAAVAPWRSVDSRDDVRRTVADLGLPIVLKTRRYGYDGKGQAWIRSADEIEAAVHAYKTFPAPKPEDMFDTLYAELPKHIQQQRADAIARGAKHTGGHH